MAKRTGATIRGRSTVKRTTSRTTSKPKRTVSKPKRTTVKPTSRFSGLSRFAGLGKLGGALGIASMAIPAYEAMFGDQETPAQYGSSLYDRMFGEDEPPTNLVNRELTIGPPRPRPELKIGPPMGANEANADELPDLAPFGSGPREDIYLPPETKPRVRPKSRAPIAGKPLPSNSFQEPLASRPLGGEFNELPPLESRDLPDNIMLGGRDINNALGTDSGMPDAQQAGGDSAFQAYYDKVRAMPVREDYKPSILRKIIGSLAGFSEGWQGGAARGFGAARNVVDMPYNNAMSDWQTEVDELEPLAKLGVESDYKNSQLEFQKWRTNLINQTMTEKNEIARLRAGNQHDAAMARIDVQAERNRAAGIELVPDMRTGELIWLDKTTQRVLGSSGITAQEYYEYVERRRQNDIRQQGVTNQGRNIDSLIKDRAEGNPLDAVIKKILEEGGNIQ